MTAAVGNASSSEAGDGPGPLAGNPLSTRTDFQRAALALWAPVRARLSPGCARARLGYTGAHFPRAAAELEGLVRPLWGLVPLAAGGAEVDWEPHLRGLAAGTDPDHQEFWGRAVDLDQRLVEMASIGFALALVPEQIWDPLEARVKRNLTAWLSRINSVRVPDSNWLFFRVMVNEGLARVGADGFDPDAQRCALDRLESFALGDGWYSDGPQPRRDYYIGTAMHTYGLIYARLAADRDPERAQRFRDRAAAFAQDFAWWFAGDGAALPFGRSLTYRFAMGAFWGALAFADLEALPWAQVKGLVLRHVRWWAGRPIFDPAGVLSIGYAYPNLAMAEEYNSPGSPYWATKIFLPLVLPGDHPFWGGEEAPIPPGDRISVQPHPGMILQRDRDGGDVVALASGQHGPHLRHGAAKYLKFAYSSAFGFSVPADGYGLARGAHDSMLALSDDGDVHWRVRDALDDWRMDGEVLYSRWSPWPDVAVETWLVPHPPWHVRVHRVRTGRPLWTAEGGFALDRTGDDPAQPRGTERAGAGYAMARYPGGASGLVDMAGLREGEVIRVAPNTNLLHPRTVLPTLRQRHLPGEHWLGCAVLATTAHDVWQRSWPAPPGRAGLGAHPAALAWRDRWPLSPPQAATAEG